MNGARQQLFAGSGLALDEDGGIRGRDGLNLFEHLAQALAFAHDVFIVILEIDFRFEVLLLLAQLVAQLGDAAEGHGVIDGHGHLTGNPGQNLRVLGADAAFQPAEDPRVPMIAPWCLSGTQQPACIPSA